MKTRTTLIGLGIVLISLVFGGRASAAAPTGLTVSPAFQLITLQSGAAQTLISFKITNDRPVAQALSFSVRDFNTLNESGGLFFVGTNPTALQKKYGLAKWLSLSTSQATLQPHQTLTLIGQILNLSDLSAGGHYGALMISLGSSPTNGKIGLQPIASSLLFVTKPDGATHRLSLSNVNFSHSLTELPASVTLRFQNTGNTHVIPRGSVYVKDPHGKLISKGIINQNSNIILPQTFRKLNVDLSHISSSSAIGDYKLRVDFRFDGVNQYRSYEAKFIHISSPILASIIVAAAGLIGLSISVQLRAKPKASKAK